jgi:hypothetical protein
LNQLTLCDDTSAPASCATFPPDIARQRAFELDQQILLLAEGGLTPLEEILALAQELLNLLRSSACQGWRERYLGEVNVSIYHLALNLSELEGERPEVLKRKKKLSKKNKYYKLAMEHLISAHRWNILLQGEEAPDSLITRSYSQLHDCLVSRQESSG